MTDLTLNYISAAGVESINPLIFNADPDYKKLWSTDIGTGKIGMTVSTGIVFHIVSASVLQDRLRSKWPSVLERARRNRIQYPDPVQALVELLGNIPGDYESWIEIIEEPYG
jgi:hypothetical protein